MKQTAERLTLHAVLSTAAEPDRCASDGVDVSTRTQAIGPLGRAALRRPVRGLRLVTDIEPRPAAAAVAAPARPPDPWAMAAVARQRHYAAERRRKLEAETRELRAARSSTSGGCAPPRLTRPSGAGALQPKRPDQHRVLPGLLG